MKIIIIITALFLSISLSAQPVVMSKDEMARKMSDTELDKQYNGSREFINETPLSVSMRIKNAYDDALGPEKPENLSISGTLYVNESGKIDYLIYDFGGRGFIVKDGVARPVKPSFNTDSLSKILNDKLPDALQNFISKRTLGKKATIHIYRNFNDQQNGGAAKIVKKDSVITDLKDALTRRDSFAVKHFSIGPALLESMPDVIYRFPNLETLSILDNDIEEVNIDMSRLPKLKHIDLTGNLLTRKSVSITKNKSLLLLNLQKNMLTDIPDAVRNCKGLETLWLGRNSFTRLSSRSFRRLNQIRDLNFYKADIASLPKGIKKMRHLEVLDLYYNELTKLPESVTKLKRLTHLAIAHNQVTALPAKIDRLKNLNVLYAHHNRLSNLPTTIVKLKYLQILDLGYNWFTDFPAQLTAFTDLQELDLSSNNFTEFPAQLLTIKKLDKLYLRGNPFLQEDKESKYGQQLGLLKNKKIEVFY